MPATKSKSKAAAAHAKNGAAAVGSKLVSPDQAAADITNRLFGTRGGNAAANDAAGDTEPNDGAPDWYDTGESIAMLQSTLDQAEALYSAHKLAEKKPSIKGIFNWRGDNWVITGCGASKGGGKGYEEVHAAELVDADKWTGPIYRSLDRNRQRKHLYDAVAISYRGKNYVIGPRRVAFCSEKLKIEYDRFRREEVGKTLSTTSPTGIRKLDQDADPNAVGQAMSGSWFVDCDLVDQNPFQPRKRFEQAAIETLASNVAQIGLLESVKVRPHPDCPGRWQLIDVARRLAAHRFNGTAKIKAERRDATDEEMLLLALATFDHKEPLSAMEHADALWLASRSKKEGGLAISIPKLAGQLGCSESHVRNTIRLAALPEPWRSRVISQEMSPRHARGMLAAIDSPGALSVLNQVWTETKGAGLTINAAEWEQKVDEALVAEGGASRKRPKKADPPAASPKSPEPAAGDDGSYTVPAFKVGNLQVVERVHPDRSGKSSDGGSERRGQEASPAKASTAAIDSNGDPAAAERLKTLRKLIAERLSENRTSDEGTIEACLLHLCCSHRAGINSVPETRLKLINAALIAERKNGVPAINNEPWTPNFFAMTTPIDDYQEIARELVTSLLLAPDYNNPFPAEETESLADMLSIKVAAEKPKVASKPKMATTAKKSGAKKKAAGRPSPKTAKRAAKRKGGKR